MSLRPSRRRPHAHYVAAQSAASACVVSDSVIRQPTRTLRRQRRHWGGGAGPAASGATMYGLYGVQCAALY